MSLDKAPMPDLDRILDGLVGLALDSISSPAGIFDKDFRIVWMNNTLGYIHRCHPKKAVGQFCHEALKGCTATCSECCMRRVLDTGRTVVTESWIDLPRGERRFGDLHAYPIRDEAGEIEAILVIAFDTTKHVLGRQEREAEAGGQTALSPRETEVLRLVTQGLTNAQISEVLDISAHTVKSHVISLFNKLGVNDRTMAAVQAVRKNLV